MRPLAALAVVAAACGGPPPAQPLEGRASTPAPTTPAPQVHRRHGQLAATGLPAVTADGRHVVFALHESDGMRGMPNLTLVMRTRTNADAMAHVVLSIAEADQMLDDAAGRNPRLDARVVEANRFLADTHANRHLIAMTALDVGTESPAERLIARGDGVIARWRDRAVFELERGGKVLVTTKTPTGWLADAYQIGTGDTCTPEAYLAATAIDVERSVALVTIGYATGSDLCGELSDRQHVVAW